MNGDPYGGRELLGEYNYHVLQDQTNATDGVWIDTRGIISGSLHVKNLAVGESIKVHCSNVASPQPPATSEVGVLKQTITGDGTEQFVAITAPVSLWKRFEKVGAVGEINADYAGVKR